jgi:DNA/RNA endonuclease G (NUC1)
MFRFRWPTVNNWVIQSHNPLAIKLSIFSGPVFGPTDWKLKGIAMPTHYWKVAVSRERASDSGLIVDAFLIPHEKNSTAPAGGYKALDYRVPVKEIEKMTGLKFVDSIRNAKNSDAVVIVPQ